MKFEHYEAVEMLMARLVKIRAFEEQWAKTNADPIYIKPTTQAVTVYQLDVRRNYEMQDGQLPLTSKQVAINAAQKRMQSGDRYILSTLQTALRDVKKEICTALYDLGVDVKELQKELSL